MLKIEDFLNKIENENLKFNDKVDIVEDAEDYKIFKIIQLETGIDYNYPIFI